MNPGIILAREVVISLDHRRLDFVDPAVVDEKGREVGPNVGGKLIIRKPWPSMLRTIYGDKARYQKQYWSEFKGNYLTGDGARRDTDGYFWIVGRIDDVLNVAGHRLGTIEAGKWADLVVVRFGDGGQLIHSTLYEAVK